MFGKFFASTFSGSMYGAGAAVFAVWGYIIANAGRDSLVELNPAMLANTLGCPLSDVSAAIEYLSSPDPGSRSKADEGRRIVREGQFQYRVVNHATYRSIRCDEDRKEYNRLAKQRERNKKRQTVSSGASLTFNEIQHIAEADTDTEKRKHPSDARPETASAVPTSPPVVTFPCDGGADYHITQEQLAKWQGYYPSLDVPRQLQSMLAWLEANPSKRKTARGCPAFVVNWLNREQNRPMVGVPTQPAHRAHQAQQASQEKLKTFQMEVIKNA
jgi:hypothetical protein